MTRQREGGFRPITETALAPLRIRKPPVTHRLVVSADRLTRYWLLIALAVAISGYALASGLLPTLSIRPRSAFFFYLFAGTCLLGAGFCWIVVRRAHREFNIIHRGDYLLLWNYSPSEWDYVKVEEQLDRRRRAQALFIIPLVAVGGGGTVLGVIGAFAKSDPLVAVRVAPGALAIGAGLGLLVCVPFWLFTGVIQRIQRRSRPEVIFTEAGVYVPGQFLAVRDLHTSQRRASFIPRQSGQPAFLRIGIAHPKSRSQPVGTAYSFKYFHFPVPNGEDENAKLLAAHYSS